MTIRDEDMEAAIAEYAREHGISVEDVRRQLARQALAERLGGGRGLSRAAAPLATTHPGSPVPRHRPQDDGETPEQAQERWLREEEELIDGVHGFGGQEAGGIFGAGAIATNTYDPNVHHRATARATQLQQLKAAKAQEETMRGLGQLLGHVGERLGLPIGESEKPRGLLGRRKRRG